MSQSSDLIDTLKSCLKSRGVTYKELATMLGISEASVRRVFSQKTFTLERLEEICRILDISLFELARMDAIRNGSNVTELSIAQERGLAADPPLLTYFYLMLTGRSTEDIAGEFGLDDRQQNTLQARLSKLKLVELMPNNKARLLTGRRIEWRQDGPIRKAYKKAVVESFMKSDFGPSNQYMRFDSGELTDESIKILKKKAEKLSLDFDELADLDIAKPASEKKAVGMLIGMRPWAYWEIMEPAANDLGLNASRSQAQSKSQ